MGMGMEQQLQLIYEVNEEFKNKILQYLIAFNHQNFPEHLRERYKEVQLYLKDQEGQVVGGLVGDICWNWLEVHLLYVDEAYRKFGYGTQLIQEAERVAREWKCDFMKLDTLDFQAPLFYKKQGFEVYGKIENAGSFTHYYLIKRFDTNIRSE